MHHDPKNPSDNSRDRFILAKGHAAPALYAVLAEAGYFPHEELMTLRKLGTRLQGHPDCNLLEGVEVSTGSLGQGLSISAGLAAGLRLENNNARVFTVMGDGECQEGQVWEAAQFAAHQKLGNLIAIVDANGLQIDGKVEDVCSSGPGGQSVNTTDSAVRLTHLPTGIVVTCQNEKSQLQNKEAAFRVLRGKLYEIEEQKRQEELSELKGEKMDNSFGSQIRNYVLYPYRLIKDTRSNIESGNVDAALDGDIEEFIDQFPHMMLYPLQLLSGQSCCLVVWKNIIPRALLLTGWSASLTFL